jgi:hypothetical protein
MTVTAASARSTFTAIGVASTLALGFQIKRAADLKIFKTPTGSSIPVLLVLTTDYSIAASSIGSPTGTVTLVTPTASGDIYVMRREVALAQDLDLRNQGAYLPENLEDTLDRIVEMVQSTTLESASVALTTSTAITTHGLSLIKITNTSGTNTPTLLPPYGVDGKRLVLHCVALTAGSFTIADSGTCALSGGWTPGVDDTLSIVASGARWIETRRSDN